MPPLERNPVKILKCAPEKRSYLSIINDYDPQTAICELIDNPIDIWKKRGGVLNIKIDIDRANGAIVVEDDSGGISESELHLVVRPGATANLEDDHTIGIFGVGSKRSVVALAKKVVISTRARMENRTLLLEYGQDWIMEESWDLPCYESPFPCEEGHTRIQLTSLWHSFDEASINDLKEHLGQTYARFLLDPRFQLTVNSERIQPVLFESWAYPPGFGPLQVEALIPTAEGKTIEFKALGGLITESAYSSGEYGVYFYFNNRLIAKALKVPEVGFARGFAGVPHHSHSIARVIVSLDGPAKYMPWNSSKSGVHFSHETYKKIADSVIDVTTCYAKVASRKLKEWRDEIFPHTSGKITIQRVKNYETVKQCLPEIPPVRPNYGEQMANNNEAIINQKPWIEAIVDGMVVIQGLQKQRVRTKNRFALVVLDSLLEMGLKEYLVNRPGQTYSDLETKAVVQNRDKLLSEVLKHKQIPEGTMVHLTRLHDLRRRLIEDKRPPDVPDTEIEQIRNALQSCFRALLGIRFPER